MLVHSPLVGPETWQPVARLLRDRGYDVLAPSLAGVFDGPAPFYRAIGDSVARQVQPSGPTAVLVAHSGAGAVLPSVAGALVHNGTAVRGAIFVDALLPGPGSWFEGAPPPLAAKLRDMANDGRLPPWNEWFPEAMIANLIPDAAMRAEFVAGIPRLPLAYFAEQPPEVTIWPVSHLAYVRLSDAYREQAAAARADGWQQVVDADLDHIAPYTRPGAVADLIEQAFAVIMTC